MDLLSAVTQRCILSPWHSHSLLRAPLKTFQISVLKNEVKYVTWSLLQPQCHPESSLTSVCVPRDFCSLGMVPDPWWHVLQPVPQTHIPSGTWSRCWALVSVSPLLNLHLRFYQRNHSDLSQQDFLNQQRRGRVWAVLHSSWWNVIWWYREQHSDTEPQNYMGLFPLPDFQILTPMSHRTENTKVLVSPVPEVSALKRKPWYSLTDTEPKWPSPIRRQAH